MRPFPGNLQRPFVHCRNCIRDLTLRIGKGPLPPLEGGDDRVGALYAPLGSRFVIDGITCERFLDATPVGSVKGFDVITADLGEVLAWHGVLLGHGWWSSGAEGSRTMLNGILRLFGPVFRARQSLALEDFPLRRQL